MILFSSCKGVQPAIILKKKWFQYLLYKVLLSPVVYSRQKSFYLSIDYENIRRLLSTCPIVAIAATFGFQALQQRKWKCGGQTKRSTRKMDIRDEKESSQEFQNIPDSIGRECCYTVDPKRLTRYKAQHVSVNCLSWLYNCHLLSIPFLRHSFEEEEKLGFNIELLNVKPQLLLNFNSIPLTFAKLTHWPKTTWDFQRCRQAPLDSWEKRNRF